MRGRALAGGRGPCLLSLPCTHALAVRISLAETVMPALAALQLEQLSMDDCPEVSGDDVLAALAAARGACEALRRLPLRLPVSDAGLAVVLGRLPHATVSCGCDCMQYTAFERGNHLQLRGSRITDAWLARLPCTAARLRRLSC